MYREYKFQALTKTVVTYQWIEVRAIIFTIILAMKRSINYWVSVPFTSPSSLQTKVIFVKKN